MNDVTANPPVDPVTSAAPAAMVAVEPAVTAAPVEAPIIETVAPATPAEPKLEPTLLERLDQEAAAAKVAESKTEPPKADAPAEAKADDKPADKPAEPPKVDAPVEAKPIEPFEYKFELPEVLKADDKRIGEFTALLNEGGGRVTQEGAQKLLNMHAQAMQDYATQTRRDQFDTFNKTKAGWEKDILADEEFGGAGHQTATRAVARARDALISSARPGTKQYERDLKSFNEFQSITGAGSHPAFWRMLHNAARFIDEPQSASVAADIRPTKGNGKNPRGGMYSEESRNKMNGAS